MRNILILMVRSYRLVFRPLLGNHCRFYPSCSQYALEALEYHGALRGSWLTLKRLLRCHPWHEGGVDPVPRAIDEITHDTTHTKQLDKNIGRQST